MQLVIRPPDYFTWNYRQVDSKGFIQMAGIADGEILEGAVGPSLKIAGEIESDKVGKIHAIALVYRDMAISSTRFITHHDSISALYLCLGANPLYARLQGYIVGFSTVDDWFLDPWQAFRVAQDKKQIHPKRYTTERVPLYTNQVLFFNKVKE